MNSCARRSQTMRWSFGGGRVNCAKFPQIMSKRSWSTAVEHDVRRLDVWRGLVSLKPDSSPSPRCLALSVERLACGSRGVPIVRCHRTGPGQIGANAGKLSVMIAIRSRRRGRGIQNQNEYEYRCQRYSKNFRVELIELLFRRLLRFHDRISIRPRSGNKGARAPAGTPRTAA
jgi:hypothetical protein